MNSAKLKREKIELLNRAFDSFNKSTNELKERYDFLQKKLKRLNIQLERKNRELEKSLKEKESAKNYLNNILESLTAGVIVINPKREITVFNREAEEITGYSSKEAVGKNFYDFFNITLNSNPHVKKRGISQTEARLITSENTQLFVSINMSDLQDAEKRIIGKIIIIQDITRLKKLEEQAQRTNRLMAMGELAVNIAHEIRNPLGSIELFASLLKRELKGDTDNQRLIEHINSSIKSLNHILSNLLLFTKTQEPVFTDIDIHGFLDNSISFISYILKQNNIRLEKSFDSKNPIIRGDEELLKQVFFNLALNSIQAMPEKGSLTVSTHVLKGDFDNGGDNKKYIRGKRFENGSSLIEIKFVDTGIGIPEGYIKSIFNPFFTTREKGTGLGLAIVHNIIESHHGCVSVESREGWGTEFCITFPVVRLGETKPSKAIDDKQLIGLERQI